MMPVLSGTWWGGEQNAAVAFHPAVGASTLMGPKQLHQVVVTEEIMKAGEVQKEGFAGIHASLQFVKMFSLC